MADEPKPYVPRCRFLTCKAMLTYGEDWETDPDYLAGAMDFKSSLASNKHHAAIIMSPTAPPKYPP